MINRRQFLKSLLIGTTAAVALPVIAKQAEPEFTLTEREYHAIKLAFIEHSGCDDIHWTIPGDKSNPQGVLLLNNYVVHWKWNHNGKTIYIEPYHKWNEPDEKLTAHIDRVWQVYMNKRTGKIS